jgi:hypothetical protein
MQPYEPKAGFFTSFDNDRLMFKDFSLGVDLYSSDWGEYRTIGITLTIVFWDLTVGFRFKNK